VDNYKDLGVWLDCKLSFQNNIKHLQSKIKSGIDFLFRNKASFTHAAKHTLVKLTIQQSNRYSSPNPLVIYKSLLGEAPPYLSSLVTIAAPRGTLSSRHISLVTPKANSSFSCLSFQCSAVNDWIELQKLLKLETHMSFTSFKHQLSEQLTDH
jgi:hypothetical protein